MIVTTINEYDFIQGFKTLRPENFSTMALVAMYETFEEMSNDCEMAYEYDVIGMCCEYSEYDSLAEVQANYGSLELNDVDDLRDHTFVIELQNGGLVIQDF